MLIPFVPLASFPVRLVHTEYFPNTCCGYDSTQYEIIYIMYRYIHFKKHIVGK